MEHLESNLQVGLLHILWQRWFNKKQFANRDSERTWDTCHQVTLLTTGTIVSNVTWNTCHQVTLFTVGTIVLLQKYKEKGFNMIASFSAASNITGIMLDTLSIAELCHRYGAKSFWDYATAAPYLEIDMNATELG